jgi:hypothetical protein
VGPVHEEVGGHGDAPEHKCTEEVHSCGEVGIGKGPSALRMCFREGAICQKARSLSGSTLTRFRNWRCATLLLVICLRSRVSRKGKER